MPKASNPPRKRFSISQIFKRRKDRRRENTWSTATESSPSVGTVSPSTHMQSNPTSTTERKGSDTTIKNQDSSHAPSRPPHNYSIMYLPNFPADHSNYSNASHSESWHEELSPVGMSLDDAQHGSMYNLDTTSTDVQSGLSRSEVTVPPRSSPKTPSGPIRSAFYKSPEAAQTITTNDGHSERRVLQQYPSGSVGNMFTKHSHTERTLPGTRPPGSTKSVVTEHSCSEDRFSEYHPTGSEETKFGLSKRIWPGTIRETPENIDHSGSNTAETDDKRVNRPYFSGSFGSEFSLPDELNRNVRNRDHKTESCTHNDTPIFDPPVTSPNEHHCDYCTMRSVPSSPTQNDLSNSDVPITSPIERVYRLQHGTPIIEFPFNLGSSLSVHPFGFSIASDTEPKDQDGHEFEIIEDHEDGKAYEDDEAWCGKCGGLWWADTNRYKTFWGETPRVEGLKESEIERWRCHRCGQTRIRKKRENALNSVESFRTARDEDEHLRSMDNDVGEEEYVRPERKKSFVPGEWPEV